MSRLTYRGDIIKNFGEFLPTPIIEKVGIYESHLTVKISIFLQALEDNLNQDTILPLMYDDIHFYLAYVIDTDPNYYKATLTYIGGNGTIVNDKQYTLIHFDISDSYDKTFIFTQAVAANPWVVVHNLNKFPSVSVTDANVTPRVVNAQVDYDNTNQVTITFSGAQAGKAYLN